MFIVIIGNGRAGSMLAGELSRSGHEVVVVEKVAENFKRLPVDFSGFQVEGDALEQDILKNARVDQADTVIVITGNDKVNYMVAKLAEHVFKVPKIIVRLTDHKKLHIYNDSKQIEVVSQYDLLVKGMLDSIGRIEG